MKKSNIVLIGFMGSGKTTIGKTLATFLNYTFIDTDEQIECQEKRSITEIFKTSGEKYFRKIESKVIKEIAQGQKQIIATGGGIIKKRENIHFLQTTGFLVYLDASIEQIYQNLKNDETRPLLQGRNKKDTIREMLKERKPFYVQAADLILPVDKRSIHDITKDLYHQIKEVIE